MDQHILKIYNKDIDEVVKKRNAGMEWMLPLKTGIPIHVHLRRKNRVDEGTTWIY